MANPKPSDQIPASPEKPKKVRKPWGYWRKKRGRRGRQFISMSKNPKTIAIPLKCCPNCGFRLPVSMNVEV